MAAHAGLELAPRQSAARGLLRRLGVLLLRPELDAQLAAGTSPATSAALALRARQLTSPPALRALADDVERIVEAAKEPPPAMSAQAPLCRGEILRCGRELRELAEELRIAHDPAAKGPAMVMELLCGPDSPVYHAAPPGDLWAAARRARMALERR
jgi:hypothetical protein